jgi:hypothetical protein
MNMQLGFMQQGVYERTRNIHNDTKDILDDKKTHDDTKNILVRQFTA